MQMVYPQDKRALGNNKPSTIVTSDIANLKSEDSVTTKWFQFIQIKKSGTHHEMALV